MFSLAIDASAGTGTVALLHGRSVAAHCEVEPGDRRSERMLPAVAAILRQCQVPAARLGRVICGDGPGNFTALRIAGAIAKGLARVSGAELCVVPSLALIPAAEDPALTSGDYLALLDALRSECYAAHVTVSPDAAISRFTSLGRMTCAAAYDYAKMHNIVPVGVCPGLEGARVRRPHARGAARLLGNELLVRPVSIEHWEPQYGRLAEAQVVWERTHRRALDATDA
ncbi:MAG: tRNA (adenosine(37)-N6)-threonylcarbamoyltransferase complex dimerization subunit type 1 TsaB [Gemmatimonadaceae bacterium]